METDKRYSCEVVPTWHEGTFFKLVQEGAGCKIILCDNTGATVPGGNVLSITSDGIVERHGGVTDHTGLIKVNPDNDQIYTYEEYTLHLEREHERERAERSAAQAAQAAQEQISQVRERFMAPPEFLNVWLNSNGRRDDDD